MPIVLLINKVGVVPLPAGVDRTYDGVMDHLKADVDRFTAASEIPVVGCFLRARGNLEARKMPSGLEGLEADGDEILEAGRINQKAAALEFMQGRRRCCMSTLPAPPIQRPHTQVQIRNEHVQERALPYARRAHESAQPASRKPRTNLVDPLSRQRRNTKHLR